MTAGSETETLPRTPWSVEFRGDGGQLFMITLANGLLNLLTLGIWFAWGRVRELTFLIENAWVAGDPLSFHGRGGELFRGILVAFFLFIVPLYLLLFVSASLKGVASALVMLAAYVGVGLLVAFASVGSMRYRLPRTQWRGIRFGFDGRAGEFLGGFIGRAVLVVLTLGFYYPAYACWRRRWMLARSRFGTEPFACEAEPGPLYRPFVTCWFLGLVTLGMAWLWYRGHQQAYLWNRSRLGGGRFTSTLTGRDWLLFQLGNALLLLVTIGLAAPWVVVRSHSYFLSRLTFDGAIDLAAIGQQLQSTGGVGEGVLGALDLDSGLDLG